MTDWPPSRHAGPQASPGFAFWHRFMDWQRGLNAALRPLALTQPQFALLAVCGWLTRDTAATTQAEVVALTGMDRMHVSQILSRLQADGLIARHASPQDHRQKTLTLTPLGAQRLASALPVVEAYDTAFFAHP